MPSPGRRWVLVLGDEAEVSLGNLTGHPAPQGHEQSRQEVRPELGWPRAT